MTISEIDVSENQLVLFPTHHRGQTFHTNAGPVILLSPEDDRNWTVLTNGGLESLIIGSPQWAEDTTEEDVTDLLVQAWHCLKEQADRARQGLAKRDEMIQDIRDYAVDRHRAGEICRDGLNTALAHFGLEPYEPRFRVEVMVRATFEINAEGEEEARRRVRYLLDGIAYSGEGEGEDLDVSTANIDVHEALAI